MIANYSVKRFQFTESNDINLLSQMIHYYPYIIYYLYYQKIISAVSVISLKVIFTNYNDITMKIVEETLKHVSRI